MKKYCRVRDHCNFTVEYTAALHRICDLKYSVSKKFFAAFHNGSNCDYKIIKKELAEEFEKQFPCLGENIENDITFRVLVEKEVSKILKIIKTIKTIKKNYKNYILQMFIKMFML